MNIDQAFPSKYLKASDLPEDGVAVPFTIAEVTTEEIGKDRQVKPVIRFKGQEKTFVANKTNCNTIAKALGSRDTDDWEGKTILLYATEVQFGDEMVESIRVKLKQVKQPAAEAPSRRAAAVEENDDIPF